MIAPLVWLFIYLAGVPITMGLIETYGFGPPDMRPDPDETVSTVLMVVLSFLWPAVLILTACFWFTSWAIWRER